MAAYRRAEVNAKKALIVAHVASGKTLGEATELAGIITATERKWRQDDPEYRKALETARDSYRGYVPQRPDEELVPSDFQGFVSKYFPDRKPHLPHQVELVKTLQTMRPAEVVLFLLWPESGKTATVEDYLCRKLAQDPSHRFRVVSQSQDHAKNICAFVKRRMTDQSRWPQFIERFGPFYEKGQERSGRPWGAEEITVARSPGVERDRSLVATSWSSATTGSRIDTVIFDDVQTPENYALAEKIFDRLRATFFTRGKRIRTLIIGHRIGPGDVYDRMIDAGLITRQIILPAAGGTIGNRTAAAGTPTVKEWWVDEDDPMVHDGGPCCGGLIQFRECPNDGSPLTAQEALDLKRHVVGDQAWFSMYQQDPTPSELTTFGQALDQCLDHNRLVGPLKAA